MASCKGIGVVLHGSRPGWGSCGLAYKHDGDCVDARTGQRMEGPTVYERDLPEGRGNLKLVKVGYKDGKPYLIYPKVSSRVTRKEVEGVSEFVL